MAFVLKLDVNLIELLTSRNALAYDRRVAQGEDHQAVIEDLRVGLYDNTKGLKDSRSERFLRVYDAKFADAIRTTAAASIAKATVSARAYAPFKH